MRNKILGLAAGLVLFFGYVPLAHAIIVIDDVADVEVSGDFTFYGNDVASGTGQNYEVLKFKPNGSATTATASDGSALDTAPHGDVKMGELWTLLNDNGITSTSTLVFGFDVNQNTDFVMIDRLTITIYDGVTPYTFTSGEAIQVYDGISGNGSSTAEARIAITLPFDFMLKYNAGSTDDFFIQATHSQANSGFEEYFLSAAFSIDGGNPVPEPMSLSLLGMGLVGLVGRRKLSRK